MSKDDVISNLKFAISDLCDYDIVDVKTEIEYAIEKLSASCRTCAFGVERHEGLYACHNTEINLTSCQRSNFSCSKWQHK